VALSPAGWVQVVLLSDDYDKHPRSGLSTWSKQSVPTLLFLNTNRAAYVPLGPTQQQHPAHELMTYGKVVGTQHPHAQETPTSRRAKEADTYLLSTQARMHLRLGDQDSRCAPSILLSATLRIKKKLWLVIVVIALLRQGSCHQNPSKRAEQLVGDSRCGKQAANSFR
jgi:hypothetical protein